MAQFALLMNLANGMQYIPSPSRVSNSSPAHRFRGPLVLYYERNLRNVALIIQFRRCYSVRKYEIDI